MPARCSFSPCWSHCHQRARCCRLGGRGGFTAQLHHSYLQSILRGKPWGHRAATVTCFPLHAAKEGSSECPSCVRCSSSQAGLRIPSLQVLPSITPDHSSVLNRRKTPATPPQGAPEVWKQAKRCWAVLSCGSCSGTGSGRASNRSLLFFSLLPLLKQSVPSLFCPALQTDGVSSQGHLTQLKTLGVGLYAVQICLAVPRRVVDGT